MAGAPTSFLEGLNQSGGIPGLTQAVQQQQQEKKAEDNANAQAYAIAIREKGQSFRSRATSKREQAAKLATVNPTLANQLYADAEALDDHADEGNALIPGAVNDPQGFSTSAVSWLSKPTPTSQAMTTTTKTSSFETGIQPGGVQGAPVTADFTEKTQTPVTEADIQAQIGQADEVKAGKADARTVARSIVGNPNKYDAATVQKAQSFLTGQSTDTSFIGQKESLYTPEFVRDNLSKDPRAAFAAARYLGQKASGLSAEDYAKLEKRTGQLDTVDELNLGLLGQALDKGALDLESGRFDLTKAQSDWDTAKTKDKQAQSGVITGWAAVGNLEALEAHKDEIIAAGFDYAKLEARAKVNREALDEERTTALQQGRTNLQTSQSQLRIVQGTEQGIINATNGKNSLETRTAAAAELLVGLKGDADRVDTLANIASKGEIGIGTLNELLAQGKIQKTEYDAAVAKAKTVTRAEQITLATAENGLTLTGFEVKLKGSTLESIIAATNSSNDLTVRVNESKKGLLGLTEKAERAEYLAQIAAKGEIGVETIKGLVSDGTITQAQGNAAITAAKKAIREGDARLASAENGATLSGLDVKLKAATIDGVIASTNAQNDYDTNLANAKKLLINITNANEQAEALAQIAAKGEIGQGILDGLLEDGEISQREHDDAMKAAGRAVTRAKADDAQAGADIANANVRTAAARETLKNLPAATVADFSSMVDELADNGDLGALNNPAIIKRAQELGVNLNPARAKARIAQDNEADKQKGIDRQQGANQVLTWLQTGIDPTTARKKPEWEQTKKDLGMNDAELTKYMLNQKAAGQAAAQSAALKDDLENKLLAARTASIYAQDDQRRLQADQDYKIAYNRWVTDNNVRIGQLDNQRRELDLKIQKWNAENKNKPGAKPDGNLLRAATESANGYKSMAKTLREQAQSLRNPKGQTASAGRASDEDLAKANDLDAQAAALEQKAASAYDQLTGLDGGPQSGAPAPKGRPNDELANAARLHAKDLGVDPNDLLSVISFETAGSFSPNARNPKSSATGLFQIMDSTARDMGYKNSADFLKKNPSAGQQMSEFARYLRGRGVKPGMGLEDIYVAVTGGARPGDLPSTVLYKKGSAQYAANKIWDVNGDGTITKGEVGDAIRKSGHAQDWMGLAGQTPAPKPAGSSPAPTAGAKPAVQQYNGKPIPPGAVTAFFNPNGSEADRDKAVEATAAALGVSPQKAYEILVGLK